MVIASGEVVSVGSGSVVEKTRVAPTSLFDQRHRNFVESQTGEQAGQSPVATVSDQALPVELLSSAQARSRSGRSLVRRFALTFELDKLVVVEGTTISVPLRLMGIEDPIQGEPRLGDTERPLVEFSHDGKGIEPSIGLVFTDRLRQVDVVLEVAPEASSGDLLAFVSGLANATVEMALLPVNVVRTVSSSGREIALGFETVTGGSLSQLWLLTNVSTQVRLVLRNSYRLEVGENVVVTLQAPAGVAVDPGTLELSPGILHGAFTVGAAQATTVVAPIVALARWMREGVGTQSVSVSLPVSIVEFEAPEMVYVPGDEDGLSAREVSGDGFFVSRHEITRGQYAAFVAETGYAAGTCWADAVFSQTLDHPVVCVSWSDAVAYTVWLSRKTGRRYGLLSEVEWEYAARAGSWTHYHFGDDEESLWENAGCRESVCGDGYEYTSPAGSFMANAFGLHDMHGNAEEWVAGCQGAMGCEGGTRVLRGGSWSDGAAALRASSRAESDRDDRSPTHGFRIKRID